jgi:hypothetical protein
MGLTSFKAKAVRIVGLGLYIALAGAAGCRGVLPDLPQNPYAPAANPPDIRKSQVAEVIDPVRLRLTDGRVVRLAHVACPEPDSGEYHWTRNRLGSLLVEKRSRASETGFRTIGTNGSGETLVELWNYPAPIFICGNTTWWELQQTQRTWYPATFRLVREVGLRPDPDEADCHLMKVQSELDAGRGVNTQ